jgi:serine/threonine-protein kinase
MQPVNPGGASVSPALSVAGVREGDVIAGKYRVDRVLGVGGMGVVVAAYHMQLDERVALKFLLPEAMKSAETVARFAREARAAVKIKSEHVARVTDVGQLESGLPYMVMEYLDGCDLSAWLRQHGPLPVEQAVEFVLQACIAVADAHAMGIVHRDLKPENLFCVRRSDGQLTIKVLDFGISKMTDRLGQGGPSFTRTTAVMGTPLYMSPEQIRSSRDVTAQSDLWALGMILFELLAGRPAFQAETMMELAVKVTNDPAPSLHAVRPDVPQALAAVIGRCLEKIPARRYVNVAELAVALLPFAPATGRTSVLRVSGIIDGAGLSARAPEAPPPPAVPVAGGLGGTLPAVGRTMAGAGSSRRTVAVGVAGAMVGLALVAGAVMFWRHGATRSDGSAQATNPPAASALAPATTEPTAPTSAPTSTPTPTSTSTPAASPPPTATSAPTATPTPAAPRAAKPSCDPPFYYDARKVRHYKQECL